MTSRVNGKIKTVLFAGNPNVGKSTVFNLLTGRSRHTGNWAGKTVDAASGIHKRAGGSLRLVDLPGAYSLFALSEEERVSREAVTSGGYDAVCVFADASTLQRGLGILIEIMQITDNVLLCVNLVEGARKRGVEIDGEKLERALGVPVALIDAKNKKSVLHLSRLLFDACAGRVRQKSAVRLSEPLEPLLDFSVDKGGDEALKRAEQISLQVQLICGRICGECVSDAHRDDSLDRRIDRLLCSKRTAVAVMLLFIMVIFFITVRAANYPSELLMRLLFYLRDVLHSLMKGVGVPDLITGPLTYGVYTVTAWVVAVMLPPMTVFFALFTVLEQAGYLPRMAFNLDRLFSCCKACGRQSLCMCMGLGCNAVGVTGCRIIGSKRERRLAILTNVFMPCNGRLPTMLLIIQAFFLSLAPGALGGLLSAGIITLIIILAVLITLICCRALSETVYKGDGAPFILELPGYKSARLGAAVIRAAADKTLSVLLRAVTVAAPCGLVLYYAARLSIAGVPLLTAAAGLLDPLAKIMGLDGMILISFILGLPANEIVLPVCLMGYLGEGAPVAVTSAAALADILASNGWTPVTALCFILFSVFHFPCSTTLLTIKRETNSLPATALAFALPSAVGFLLCAAVSLAAKALG